MRMKEPYEAYLDDYNCLDVYMSKNFFGRKTAKFRYFFYFSVTFSKKLQKNFFALHLKNQQETLEIISTLQKSSGKIYRKLTN